MGLVLTFMRGRRHWLLRALLLAGSAIYGV